MRPSSWHPSVEPSSFEQTIIKRIKRAKLFVFLRHHRHELFDDAFQEELATLYAPSLRGQPPIPPAQEDTYNLVGHALKKVIRVVANQQERELVEVASEAGAELVCGTSLKAALDRDWDQ